MENKLENNSAEGEGAQWESERRRRKSKNNNNHNKKNNKKKRKVESKTVEKCGSDDGKWLQNFPPSVLHCFLIRSGVP